MTSGIEDAPRPSPQWKDDEIDLLQLFQSLWQRKWLIALIASLSTFVGVGYALYLEPVFRSEALLQVREENKSGGGLAALAGQLGGLADFAGISAGGAGSGRPVVVATLKSRVLIDAFLAEKNLLPVFFKSAWNANTNSWKASDVKKQPSLQKGYELFTKSLLKVSEDKKTGLVTVAIEWKDPVQAAEWVSELVRRTNLTLKTRTIEEGQRNLNYLEEQAKTTQIVEVQKSIYALMESELKKLMVAKNGDDFALKMIDPPQAPERRIRPKRTLIVLMSGLIGLMLGVFWVLIRQSFRRAAAMPAV